MNKLNQFSVSLVVVSFVLFLSAYFYHKHAEHNELKYSKIITSITSSVLPKPKNNGPQFTSGDYVFTEERGILITMLFCVFLLFVSVVLNFIDQKKYGKNRIQLPLTFSAFLVGVMIIVTINHVGLFYYA